MECSVNRLQLQRKIIFVAYPARELLTRANDDHCALCLTIRSRLGDRLSNLLDRMSIPVAGQIGSDKSAVARNHVAGGTAGIPVKQGLPTRGIAGQGGRFVGPLENAQIGDDCLDVRTCKRMEGRHSSSGDTFLNDARQLSIRKPLHFAILSAVWGALSTATIQAVTTCAGGSEDLLSFAIRRIKLRF